MLGICLSIELKSSKYICEELVDASYGENTLIKIIYFGNLELYEKKHYGRKLIHFYLKLSNTLRLLLKIIRIKTEYFNTFSANIQVTLQQSSFLFDLKWQKLYIVIFTTTHFLCI